MRTLLLLLCFTVSASAQTNQAPAKTNAAPRAQSRQLSQSEIQSNRLATATSRINQLREHSNQLTIQGQNDSKRIYLQVNAGQHPNQAAYEEAARIRERDQRELQRQIAELELVAMDARERLGIPEPPSVRKHPK